MINKCNECYYHISELNFCTNLHSYCQKDVDDIRAKAIEECKEVVRQHRINGTVAHRIAEEIYGDLEKLKEQKYG